jgi:phosphoglucosamine mutase
VRVKRKQPFSELPEVMEEVRMTEEKLGERGRLVLRYSGTESLARIMIEGQDYSEIERLAQNIAVKIEKALGK